MGLFLVLAIPLLLMAYFKHRGGSRFLFPVWLATALVTLSPLFMTSPTTIEGELTRSVTLPDTDMGDVAQGEVERLWT